MKKSSIIILSIMMLAVLVGMINAAEPRIEDGIIELSIKHNKDGNLTTEFHKNISLIDRTTIALMELSIDTIDMQRDIRDKYFRENPFVELNELDGQEEIIWGLIKKEYNMTDSEGVQIHVYAVKALNGSDDWTYNEFWMDEKGENVLR